ncbi:MAG: hypothetical protein ACREI2_05130 [Nitrospiraceae bacterium]
MIALLLQPIYLTTGLIVGCTLLGLAIIQITDPFALSASDWVPSEQEIQNYRKSWNPFSHGPLLIQAVDIHPKGHFSIRPFIFSQIGEKRYGNRMTLLTERKDGNFHLYSVQHPFINVAYGLTNHVEIGLGTSIGTFWAKDSESFNQGRGGPTTTNTGLGDTTLTVKYRPIVQDPDTRRPSITLTSQLVLPTGVWFTGTEAPPGGFAPEGRFPVTQFGSLGLTQGVTFRKNLKPFRVSGGAYYTYQIPGSNAGQTTYTPDLVNTRLIFEHILDDKTGLGYNIELVGLHGTTWRADGHSINRGQKSGSQVFGVEPAIQWRFGQSNFVGAAGVLFTVAGQNSIDAIYPNFSVFWFWSEAGKEVIMR